MGIKQRIVSPFKWLFAKRKRWIPAVIILSLIALPFVVLGSHGLYRYIDYTLDDIRYSKGEEARIEQLQIDLENSQKKWQSSNITSYKFKLDLLFGGETFWEEGSHGRSEGPQEERTMMIIVNDIDNINVIDSVTSNNTGIGSSKPNVKYFPYYGKSAYSIPELFNIIQDCLDNPYFAIKVKGPEGFIPSLVSAVFNEQYGFPEFITIYVQLGNYEDYHRIYFVTYEISEFKVIE